MLLCACPPETADAPADNTAARAPGASARAMIAAPAPQDHRLSVFPKSPMPQHLVVLDGYALSQPERYLMTSLQGVLAKSEPRLYFDPSPTPRHDLNHEEEGRWLEVLETKYGVTWETADDSWAVLDQYIDEVDGYIVYDPELPQTVNVATPLAGIHHALIAHPDLIPALTARGLNAVDDLRERFEDDTELYTWAFENVWPQCHPGLLAFLDHTLPPLRDYLVAHNVFTVQLDFGHHNEGPLLDRILAETPANIPILGWPLEEYLGMITFSSFNKFHVCNSGVPNLTVHSGLPAPELTQDHITEWPVVENKIHVAFAFTDGDSMGYLHQWMAGRWDDPARGEVPIGWEMSIAPVDLSPDVISYFYANKTDNDVIIGPASGLGYIYPNHYDDLDAFLDLTAPYMAATDMRTIWLINDDLTLPDDIVVAYAQALDLNGIFIDYWPNSDKKWRLASDGTPVLRSRYAYFFGMGQVEKILADALVEKEYLYPDVPTFVFIGLNGWEAMPGDIKDAVDDLDDRYVVLRPDAMFAAMRTAAAQGLLP